VRSGASKPDVGSTDTFKRALIEAKSIAYAGEGAAGQYFIGVLDRLGIASEMKPKLKLIAGNPVGAILKGEADVTVTNIPPIMAEPAVELAGSLPAELQNYISYTAGVSSTGKETGAAKALINFFTSAPAAAVMKAKGVEPR